MHSFILITALETANQKIMAVIYAQRAQTLEQLPEYGLVLADAQRVIECFRPEFWVTCLSRVPTVRKVAQ